MCSVAVANNHHLLLLVGMTMHPAEVSLQAHVFEMTCLE
jgi:hypothetical protein